MKRLLASVAISALALSGAAFAADAPTAVQKDQAPMAQTTTPSTPSATTPAKPSVADSHAKKPATVKKDKTSMSTQGASRSIHLAQAPAPSTSVKPTGDDAQAKKPAEVKKTDKKATTGTEQAQPASPAKPATR